MLLEFKVMKLISFLAKTLYGKDEGPLIPLETRRVAPFFSY